MGLDIVAVKNVTFVTEDFELGRKTVGCFNVEVFADRAADLRSGFYTYDEEMSFRAGSYGGYHHWRSQLCRLVYGVPAEHLWDHRAEYLNKPFFELIEFTDCDGTIGTTLCKKLHLDFMDAWDRVRDTAYAQLDEDEAETFLSKYKQFWDAFSFGAENGFVLFC